MRGRKPQATALKLLRGNPGRRATNPAEPQHRALDPTLPAELASNPIAAAEWARVAAVLGAHGHVTTVDRAVLIGYCLKWAQWLALETVAASEPLILKTPRGYAFASPALGAANKVFALLMKAAAELGITPSARSRVQTTEPTKPAAPVSKWAGLLK